MGKLINSSINNEKEVLRAASFVLGKEINHISQLTDNQLLFFSSLTKWELSKSFCTQDVANGLSYRQIGQKYGVSKDTVKNHFNRE